MVCMLNTSVGRVVVSGLRLTINCDISENMASERYSFSLTTFSPSGKLVQIEYALMAVASGAPSVGIKVIRLFFCKSVPPPPSQDQGFGSILV